MNELLRVANLSTRRGAREVLRDVSFTVREQEILGVIGPNGAGKSTLFECVAGVLPFDRGSIEARTELFYVPDGIRPWPDQSVRWTVETTARMFGQQLDESLFDALDLRPLQHQRVGALSKGEAKRTSIAMGLSVPRPMLFLDEPFDGLDLRQMRKTAELLRSTRRTLVLSIHQLHDAERVCDRFLLLNEGRSVAEGTLAELGGNLEEVFLART